ncbi:hypothetical protein V6Z11_D02G063600 [Gossypium hirsutum]
MTKIKRGYIARRCRTKISLFASSFRGAYSRKQLLLNRKILAQIAISNRNCLYIISNEIRK